MFKLVEQFFFKFRRKIVHNPLCFYNPVLGRFRATARSILMPLLLCMILQNYTKEALFRLTSQGISFEFKAFHATSR